jgi:regulator of cell morphogenesis and NO signaling
MNAVLFDIFNCEKDLALHTDVEDRLFVPAVLQLEENVKMNKGKMVHEVSEEFATEATISEDNLSQREKEIVRLVVRGLSNKEIAEELFISVHTVITHRRNIARKLEIHSPTLLTVYAIVNKLVDISEVKLSLSENT